MYKKLLLAGIILIVAAIILIKTVNFSNLATVLSQLTLTDIANIAVWSMSILLLRSFRFYLLLRDRDLNLSWWSSLRSFVPGEALSILPGNDTARVYLLKQDIGASPAKTAAPVLSHAAFDFVVAAVVTTSGSIFYPELRLPVAIMDTLLVLSLILILHPGLSVRLISILSMIPAIRSHQASIAHWRKELADLLTARSYRRVPGRTTIFSILIALAIMAIGGLLFQFLAGLTGKMLPWPLASLMYASSIVIAAISGVVPAGLGLTEGGIVGLMYILAGMNYQQAIALALLYRAATTLFNMVVGLIFGTAQLLHQRLFRRLNLM